MSVAQDYLDLTKKYKADYGEKTIVLLEVGSFFEVYALINPDGTYTGSNIVEFAKINEMVIAKKNLSIDKMPVAMAGMGTIYADKYIKKLQEHDYTVVIYKQEGSGKNITRNLSEIISPGTFFPSEGEPANLSNNIMCIWLHHSKATKSLPAQVTVGMANLDIYTGKTSLFQFAAPYNHSPATYDELERYISAYRPSECLMVANLPSQETRDILNFVGLENTKVHHIGGSPQTPASPALTPAFGERSPETGGGGVSPQMCAKNAEKQIYQAEILKRFYPQLAFSDFPFQTHHVALQAFCFLLDFVYQHSPNLVKKITEPIFENYSERLILSNHTLHQLNIIDDFRHTGRLRSVSSLLNNCVTTMGKRQFLYNLHYPITQVASLQAAYDITEHLLTQGTWDNLRTPLSAVSDMEKFARRIIARKIQPKNLTTLAADLIHIESLHEVTQSDAVLLAHLSTFNDKKIKINIGTACKLIRGDMERVFNLEACQNLTDLNDIALIVNKGISPILDEYCQANMDGYDKLDALCNFLSGQIQEQEKSSKSLQYVKLHETSKSHATLICTSRRVVLLKTALAKNKTSTESITATAKAMISYKSRYSKKTETFEFDLSQLEYSKHGSSKTELLITSPQLRALTGANEDAKERLIKETQAFFLNYITEFAKFEEEFRAIIKYTTALDLLQCKCYIAHKYNYCKPRIQKADKSCFAFTGIRHPLIEHLQTNELYVTNDLALGTSAAGTSALGANGILLYGTNAVGKTSFIKSVGIAVIMAQAGLYVPCETFTYQPYRNIFTRILGNDNLFKGLSTFAVEMTELRTILTMANPQSLVLGDELCSGTESDSALSIFTAGLEILHARDSTFLFATHFHEITNYEEITALTKMKMLHMAVHYNKETNVLVYDRKLREGPGESMYGLEVCKSLNLPEAFLQRAHDIRMKYQPAQQNVLSLSTSHFNTQKLVGLCELCHKKKASEVHHLQHQQNANPGNEYIQSFHKNHVANLLSICEACHKKIHKTKQQHKVVKTTGGYILEAL
jgi:DNA mismatch repair protein MutS